MVKTVRVGRVRQNNRLWSLLGDIVSSACSRVCLRRQESRSKLGEGVGGDWPTGPALLVFEDQSAKPEERHAADPDGLHCGFQRRTDLRFAIEGHEDEDQKERSHLKVGHVCPKDTLFFNATPKSSYHTVTAQFSARTPRSRHQTRLWHRYC